MYCNIIPVVKDSMGQPVESLFFKNLLDELGRSKTKSIYNSIYDTENKFTSKTSLSEELTQDLIDSNINALVDNLLEPIVLKLDSTKTLENLDKSFSSAQQFLNDFEDKNGDLVIIPFVDKTSDSFSIRDVILQSHVIKGTGVEEIDSLKSTVTNFSTQRSDILNNPFVLDEIYSSLAVGLFKVNSNLGYQNFNNTKSELVADILDYIAVHQNELAALIDKEDINKDVYIARYDTCEDICNLLTNEDNKFLNQFIKYLNRTFKTKASLLEDESESTFDDDIAMTDSNKVHDDKIALKVNQENNVNTMVKMAFAMTPKLQFTLNSNNQVSTKSLINELTGLPIFMSLPEIWPTIVYAHRTDSTKDDYIDTLEKLSNGKEPSLATILDRIKTDDDFANAYIVSVNMAYSERDAVTIIDEYNKPTTVRLATQNRNSFLGKQYSDKVSENLITRINNKDFTTRVVNQILPISTNPSDYKKEEFCNKTAHKMKLLLNHFGIKINEFDIARRFKNEPFVETEVHIERYNSIIKFVKKGLSEPNGLDTNIESQLNNYIYYFLENLSDSLDITPELSTLNVEGSTVQTPHYPSFVTDMFSQVKATNSAANQIKERFKDLLTDPRAYNMGWLVSKYDEFSIFQAISSKYYKLVDGELVESTELEYDIETPNLEDVIVKIGNYEKLQAHLIDGLKDLSTKEGTTYDVLVGSQYNLFSLVTSIVPSLSRSGLVSYILPSSDSATTYSIGGMSYEQDLIVDGKINTKSRLYNQFKKAILYDVQNAAISVSRLYDIVDGKLQVKSKFLDETLIEGTNITERELELARLHNVMENTLKLDSGGLPTANAFLFRNYDGLLESILAKDSTFFTKPLLVMESLVESILPEYLEGFANTLIENTIKIFEPDLQYLSKLRVITKSSDSKGSSLISLSEEDSNYYKTVLGKFALNKFIFNTTAQHIIFGDTFEYKGSIDYNKRNGEGAKRGESGLSGLTYTAITMNDPSLTTILKDHYIALKKSDPANKAIYESWLDEKNTITIADGFSVITLNEYIKRLHHFGQYQQYADIVEQLGTEGNTLTSHQFKRYVESLKYFTYSRTKDHNDKTGRVSSTQFKCSTMVLSPAFHSNSQWGQLLEFMNKYKIDQINGGESKKVGSGRRFNLFKNGLFVDPLKNAKPEDAIRILDPFIKIEPLNSVRQQLKIPSHIVDTDSKLSIQLIKQAFLNVKYDYKYAGRTGKEVFESFQNSYVSVIKRRADEVVSKLGKWELDPSGKTVFKANINKVLDYLRNNMDDSLSNDNIEDTIRDIQNGYASALPFESTTAYNKLMSVITSLITNKVTKMKMPGMHTTLIPDFLHTPNLDRIGELTKDVTDETTKKQIIRDYIKSNSEINYRDSYIDQMVDDIMNNRPVNLRAENTYVNGVLQNKCQIILSRYDSKFFDTETTIEYNAEKFIDDILADGYELLDVSTNDKTGVTIIRYSDGTSTIIKEFKPTIRYIPKDINTIPVESLRGVATRIPGEGKHSMITYEVVGFTSYNNTQVIAPYDLVSRTGWDFDGDSLYMYRKSLGSDLKPISYSTESSEVLNRYSDYNKNFVDSEILNNLTALELNNFAQAIHDLKIFESKHADNSIAQTVDLLSKPTFSEQFTKLKDYVSTLYPQIATNSELVELLPDLLANNADKAAFELFVNILGYNKVNNKFVQTGKLSGVSLEDFKKLPIAEQNSLEANMNNMVDEIDTILSNIDHAGEVSTPNESSDIEAASKYVNQYSDISSNINENTVEGETILHNLNLDTRNLKGNAVNANNTLHLSGRLNTKLPKAKGIKLIIPISQISGELNDDKLNRLYGAGNWEIGTYNRAEYLYVNDVNHGSAYDGSWLDLNDELISKQQSELLSNILDAVKKRMGFNINDTTLSVLHLMTGGVTVVKGNRFSVAMNLLHQPSVVKAVKYSKGLNSKYSTLENGIKASRIELCQMYVNSILNPNENSPLGEESYVAPTSFEIETFIKLAGENLAKFKSVLGIAPNIARVDGKTLEAIEKAIIKTNSAVHQSLESTGEIIISGSASFRKALTDELDVVELEYTISPNYKRATISLSYVHNQLKALRKFEEYEATAADVRAVGNILTTDKIGAGVNVSISRRLLDNLSDIASNFTSITRSIQRDINKLKERVDKTTIIKLQNQLNLIKEAYLSTGDLSKIATFKEAIEPIIEELSNLNDGEITISKQPILSSNGKNIVELVYPHVIDSTKSIYDSKIPYLAASMEYSNNLAVQLFSQIDIFNHPDVRNISNGILMTTSKPQSEETRTQVNKFLQTYFMGYTSFFSNINVAQLLGFNESKIELKASDLNNSDNTIEFAALSVFDKLNLLTNGENQLIEDYYTDPQFKNSHIINQLTTRVNKQTGLKTLTIRNDADLKLIQKSVLDMYNRENNPYFRNFVEDLYKYAYVIEGFKFGYGISKGLPNSLFYETSSVNSNLQDYAKEYYALHDMILEGAFQLSESITDLAIKYHSVNDFKNATIVLDRTGLEKLEIVSIGESKVDNLEYTIIPILGTNELVNLPTVGKYNNQVWILQSSVLKDGTTLKYYIPVSKTFAGDLGGNNFTALRELPRQGYETIIRELVDSDDLMRIVRNGSFKTFDTVVLNRYVNSLKNEYSTLFSKIFNQEGLNIINDPNSNSKHYVKTGTPATTKLYQAIEFIYKHRNDSSFTMSIKTKPLPLNSGQAIVGELKSADIDFQATVGSTFFIQLYAMANNIPFSIQVDNKVYTLNLNTKLFEFNETVTSITTNNVTITSSKTEGLHNHLVNNNIIKIFEKYLQDTNLVINNESELDFNVNLLLSSASLVIKDPVKLNEFVTKFKTKINTTLDTFNSDVVTRRYSELLDIEDIPNSLSESKTNSDLADAVITNSDFTEADKLVSDFKLYKNPTILIKGEFSEDLLRKVQLLNNKLRNLSVTPTYRVSVLDSACNLANHINAKFILTNNNNSYLSSQFEDLGTIVETPSLNIRHSELPDEHEEIPLNNKSNAEKAELINKLCLNNITLNKFLKNNFYGNSIEKFHGYFLNERIEKAIHDLNYEIMSNALLKLNAILSNHINKLNYDFKIINAIDILETFNTDDKINKAALSRLLVDGMFIFEANDWIDDLNLLDIPEGASPEVVDNIKKTNEQISELLGKKNILTKLKNIYTDKNKEYLAGIVDSVSRNPSFNSRFADYLKQIGMDYKDANSLMKEIETKGLDNAVLRDTISKMLSNNRDVSSASMMLDSIFDSGIPIIDNVLMQYLYESYLSKAKVNKIVDEAITALKEIGITDLKLEFNKNRRDWFANKFVDIDNLSLISEYKWKEFYESYDSLGRQLFDISNKITQLTDSLKEDPTLEVTVQPQITILLNQATELENNWFKENLENYNESDISDIEISDDEYNRLRVLKNSRRQSYYNALRNNNYHTLQSYNIDKRNLKVIRMSPKASKYHNTKFDKLTDKDKLFLNKFKELIHTVSRDNFEGFEPNNTFLPISVAATEGETLRHIIGLSQISSDKSFQGFNGQIEYLNEMPMVSLPEFHPVFNYNEVYKSMSNEVQQDIIYKFNVKFAKQLSGKHKDVYTKFLSESGKTEIKTLKDIDDYNKYVNTVNRDTTIKRLELDPLSLLQAFATRGYEYGVKSKFLDTYRLLRKEVGSSSFSTKDKKGRVKVGTQNRVYKELDAFQKTLLNVPIVTTKLGQMGNMLRGSTSLAYMQWNLLAGLNNLTIGMTNVLMESAAGEFIDGKSLKDAISYYRKSITSLVSSLNHDYTDNKDVAFMKHYESIYNDRNESLMDKHDLSAASTLISKLNSFGYLSNNITEHFMQFSMLLAAARSHRVIGGKPITFYQYIHSLRMNEISNILTPEQLNSFNKYSDEKIETSNKYNSENDYLRDWIVENKQLLTSSQIKDINTVIKTSTKEAKAKFEKYPTLYQSAKITNGRLDFGDSIDAEEAFRFGRKVQKVNHYLHGVYNQIDRSLIRQTVLGELAMQFRKWMKPNWDRMYGTKFFDNQFNEGLQAYQYGSFAAAWNLFRRPIQAKYSKADNKILGAISAVFGGVADVATNYQLYMNTMSLSEKAAVQRMFRNIQVLLGMTMALVAVSALAGDDDEDKNEAIRNNQLLALSFFLLNSGQADLGQLYPMGWIPGLLRMQKSAIAGESLAVNLFKASTNLMKYPFVDEEARYYQTGIYKGELKFVANAKKATPIVRQFIKITNLPEQIGYYKMYNQFGLQ